MLAPKKGLLCNLNHIHLQHISLGLHLSRHPELQETSASMGAGDQTSCNDCPENCEQVDANSNNPSLKCRCCESHTQQLVTFGLQNQAAQEDFPCLQAGDEVASPCDPPCDLDSSSSSSSSVSSCSDFSLDDSPVSVYCKGFSREQTHSPENQPNVIPIEDAQDGQLLADQSRTCDGRDANLNPPALQRSDALAGESPDSLCSITSLNSQHNEPSPSAVVQETTSICANLDRNCNSLPNPDAVPLASPSPGRWEPSLSSRPEPQPRAGSVPPPVPPRPRRRLQVLNAHRAEQPLLPVQPAEPEPSLGDLSRDASKKTITSFHELAQKRKRNTTGPSLAHTRVDRSDWLIVFSPDTELPPPSELLSSATGQEPARPQLQQDWAVKPPSTRQREVTTFKELRFRSASNKPKGQPAGERAEPAAPWHPSASPEPAVGSDGSGWLPPMPLGGHSLAPTESHQPKRRRSRPGLQPIEEGQLGDAEEGGLPPRSCLPGEKGLGSARGKDTLVGRLQGARGDAWAPGAVEREGETREEARPSPSAAGAAAGADRPGGGSPEGARWPRAEQKKALLIAVSAAVDKIIAHFSSARNLVQKAQLGDSRLSPDVGYLLLHTLCPALYALVEDGLKPFQKDVITGQRKNSPWSVVEASVKTGPNTRSLHSLCWHVAGLAPLNSARQKFHAFILGLLNIKQLELWISHLQKSPGVISVLYSPMAFFALSQGPLPHLADELLLLIQPLSVLTFHLDLLFEHHHLSVDVRPLSRRLESPMSPAHQAWGAVPPSPEGQNASGASLEDEIPPDALGRSAGAEDSTRSRSSAAVLGLVPGPQVGAALQQTFQHVLRWGDQLSRTLLGADGSPETHGPEAAPQDAEAGLGGWWGQLSQASRIYTAPGKEKFPFVWWTKLRTATGDSSPIQAARPQIPRDEPRGTELQQLQTKADPELSGPKPSSSADTSGTSSPEDLTLPAGAGAPTQPDGPAAGEKLLAASPEPHANGTQAATSDPGTGSSAPDKGSWLGRLFGATSPSARSFLPNPDTISARSRRPSSWLSPSACVLAMMVKGPVAERTRGHVQPERSVSNVPAPQTHRAVRALCDHTGTADGHLSFQKGDVLQLLSTVDEDWIRCCHGNSTGLVPVGYTSLIL